MQEKGVDVSKQTSRGINAYLGKLLFQTLITLYDDAEKNCPTVWPGVNTRLHWSFDDPAALHGTKEENLRKFRQIRDSIEAKIKTWLTEQGIPVQQ